MGSPWDHFGITLGSFWDDVGIILGSIWDQFGVISGSFLAVRTGPSPERGGRQNGQNGTRLAPARTAPDWKPDPPTSLSVERVRLMNLAYPLTYLHTRPIHLSAYILKYLGGVRGGATTPPDFVGLRRIAPDPAVRHPTPATPWSLVPGPWSLVPGPWSLVPRP